MSKAEAQELVLDRRVAEYVPFGLADRVREWLGRGLAEEDQ